MDTFIKFYNLKSQMWWYLAYLLENGLLSIPEPDVELLADLTSVKYFYMQDKSFRIESKDELKKRLNRSPDKGDALCIAVFMKFIRGEEEDGVEVETI